MPRVKRAKVHLKKRRKIRKATKGYKWGRKSSIRLGKTAILKAGQHALRDRRKKKGQMRRLWQIRINAAVREHGTTYSKFINALKINKIEIDRKMLADLAVNNPQVFAEIVKKASTSAKAPSSAKASEDKSADKKGAKAEANPPKADQPSAGKETKAEPVKKKIPTKQKVTKK